MIDPPLPERKRDYWGTIFNAVVPDDNNGESETQRQRFPPLISSSFSVVMKSPANLRYPKFGDDRRLGVRYSRAMQILQNSQVVAVPGNQK